MQSPKYLIANTWLRQILLAFPPGRNLEVAFWDKSYRWNRDPLPFPVTNKTPKLGPWRVRGSRRKGSNLFVVVVVECRLPLRLSQLEFGQQALSGPEIAQPSPGAPNAPMRIPNRQDRTLLPEPAEPAEPSSPLTGPPLPEEI